MTKRDRFEAMAGEHSWFASEDCIKAATLLRREHASVVRAVGNIKKKSSFPWNNQRGYGYQDACDDILAMLAKRKEAKK